jgi:multiple sugar transport system ATP-binding protein
MAQIKLEHIDKVYDNGFQAVYDFNLDINDNEFIVFVGPSGCGKSTTLRMIAGLEMITRGHLYINGKLVNNIAPKDRGIAMVFQSYALYPHLSVYENMAFGLQLQGVDDDEIEERVNETARILGLENYLDRKPRELSGGQRQRVALGRAIIRKADVYLMDEPLSNLDAKQRVHMRSEIIKIHKKVNATTIYVTHDQVEAMTMADRIVVMKDGVVQQIGTPEELYFHPSNTFVAGFIGDPPMNFLNGTIDNEGYFVNNDVKVKLSKDQIELTRNHIGGQVILGFRPEDVNCDDLNNNDGVILKAKVEIGELLGDNRNLYCNLGNSKIILRVNPYVKFELDSPLAFNIPYKNIHLFDKETENRLNKVGVLL